MAPTPLLLYLPEMTSAARDEASRSDGALARDVVAGSPAAERELCARFAPRIRLYGLRHLRSEAAAQDLAQDVLVVVLDALRGGRVRDPDGIASFVLGTCRSVALQQRRGEQRRSALLDRFGSALEGAAPEPTLDRARLAGCVGALAPREQAVVALAWYAERTAAEIGAELGITPENARAIRHRTLGKLRACMGVEEDAS
jgi:RNA polymerase sigma-70 factor (ECF subfamily)